MAGARKKLNGARCQSVLLSKPVIYQHKRADAMLWRSALKRNFATTKLPAARLLISLTFRITNTRSQKSNECAVLHNPQKGAFLWSGRYKSLSLILENYPTLTRVSASHKRAGARRKKVRFAFTQVGKLKHFCSAGTCALRGNFWVQNACQSGVIF